jgi:hypothetical protein
MKKLKKCRSTAMQIDTHVGRLAQLEHSADSCFATSGTGSNSSKRHRTDRKGMEGGAGWHDPVSRKCSCAMQVPKHQGSNGSKELSL